MEKNKEKAKKDLIEKFDQNLKRFQDIDIMDIEEDPEERRKAMELFGLWTIKNSMS